MIKAVNLSKKIGKKEILRAINLLVEPGEFVTILGPNGAGKTTLLKILSLLLPPSTGQLFINDRLVGKEDSFVLRKGIGMISHHSFLYENLTAEENLRFYGRMYDVDNLNARIEEVLDEVGLSYCFKDPVRTFSRGMQQRLSIARAILHNPFLLFFDEPYTGLDQNAIAILNEVVRRLTRADRTIFMVTHNYEQGLELSNRLLIVNGGRIVYDKPDPALSAAAFRDVYKDQVGGASAWTF